MSSSRQAGEKLGVRGPRLRGMSDYWYRPYPTGPKVAVGHPSRGPGLERVQATLRYPSPVHEFHARGLQFIIKLENIFCFAKPHSP